MLRFLPATLAATRNVLDRNSEHNQSPQKNPRQENGTAWTPTVLKPHLTPKLEVSLEIKEVLRESNFQLKKLNM